jgi:outer membrane protein OmpA-like peptidoglycan-associated protein
MLRKLNKNKLFVMLFFINALTYCQIDSINQRISKNFLVEKLSFNSDADEFGGFVIDNEMYFTSNKKVRRGVQFINKEDKKYLYNIYKVSYDALSKKNISQPKLIKGVVNTKMNQSSPFITKDKNTMYYTGSKLDGRKKNNNLRILKATKKNNKWSDVQDLLINDDSYSNAHQVFNKKENKMYFISNRKNGLGGADIYSVEIDIDGSFGEVKNLGPKINSNKNEVHPFITEDNELYFSSNRDSGYGGLDIFYVNLNSKDKKVYNLGSLINSKSDDFSFSMNSITNRGFVSSNKEGNINVYGVSQLKPVKEIIKKDSIKKIDPNFIKKIDILDYTLVNSLNKLEFEKHTNTLSLSSEVFLDSVINHLRLNKKNVLDVNSIVENKNVDLKLYNQRVKIAVDYIRKSIKYSYRYISEEDKKEDLISNKKINFKEYENNSGDYEYPEVYFLYNSSYLSTEDKIKLESLIKTLKVNPHLKITIKTKADSRGGNQYNLQLTIRRLHRINEYLFSKGIAKNRITGFALGENKISNKCTNNIECSDNQHRINRKIEFKLSTKE